jgi:hypothetical protein
VRVLIALVAAAGCYNPTVGDCQFKCGANNACPSGTSCVQGICRTSTTGNCPTDAGACPASSPCGVTPVAIPSGGCAVLCQSSVTVASAKMMCNGNGWHLASTSTAAKRADYKTRLPAGNGWVDLTRTSPASFVWGDGTGESATSSNWATGEPRIADDDGTLDTTGSPTVLRTGAPTDTLKFFCEHS